MSEKIPTQERIPSEAEVYELFHHLFQGEHFEVKRRRSDEKELYLFEAQLTGQDAEGYLVELIYCRKGSFDESKSLET
jgi:hypothetical protein